MSQTRTPPSQHTFKGTRHLLEDFVTVDEYVGAFELYDARGNGSGRMSGEQRLLVVERGDSVAAVLYDPAHREIILTEQFRLPTLVRQDGSTGWLLEPPAGIIQANETVEQTIVREVREETGYQVASLVPIATFLPSPGACSERIHLFFAEVRRAERIDPGGGVVAQGENIHVLQMPLVEFFAKLRDREFRDAKLLIGGYWLKDRLAALPFGAAAKHQKVDHQLPLPPVSGWFGSRTPEKSVGYLAGDIREVKDIDVWVNPLTADMLLDKFTDRTISAAIRAAGAVKYPNGDLEADRIGDDLRSAMRGRVYVDVSTVLPTSAGELRRTNGVQQILHVAIVKGQLNQRPRTDRPTIERCIDRIFERLAKDNRYRSVAIPIIGTGEGGLLVKEVAPMMVDKAIAHLKANPAGKLDHIYLMPYSDVDVDEVARAFDERRAILSSTPRKPA